MSDTVIKVENLSKSYTISHQNGERYTALRDVLSNGVKSVASNVWRVAGSGWRGSVPDLPLATRNTPPTTEEFWALNDVSFEVKQGERVGIIGRNGAGKSTLLKILSRITEPTKGRIHIKGRVASLLEVGTGFHPELTGRENISLNGAILGMSRDEIRRKFDEIVAFAEVERFLDTPVKRYSSGMYVRLAFAVAAHLEPEILVVDEVLAVGDAAFQKKCLGKMEDVSRNGRTVLFVSHQMSAIQKLCSRVTVLNKGTVQHDGLTKSAIDFYLNNLESQTEQVEISSLMRSGTGEVQLTGFHMENTQGEKLSAAASGEDLVLVFQCYVTDQKPITDLSIGFSLHNLLGDTISILYSDYMGKIFTLAPGNGLIKCKIKEFPYSLGRYLVGARVTVKGREVDWPKGFIGYIDVEAGDFFGTGSITKSGIGPVLIKGDWYKDNSTLSHII